jgi:hypothetical protein
MYELPENISELDAEAIDAAIDGALDAWNALNISVESSDEELDQAEALKAGLDALRVRQTEIVATAEARAERVAALAPEVEEETATEIPAEAVEVEVVEEPVAAAAEEVVAPEVVEEVQEPVLAAAETPSPVARAAAAAPEVIVPQTKTTSLIAAADVPGYSNGQELEGLEAVTAAVLSRTKGLPSTNLATAQGGVRQRYGAALIKKDGFGDLVQRRDGQGDMNLVWKAGDQSRLDGGSLVAAGGWCAPSETLYDLCQYETLEGMLSIPEFQVNRGGIRFTQGPSFDDIYNACGFVQTEAEAIAGDCKDCCMVDCPDFDEIRLDAIGLCVKSPLLTETAYPELVQRFIEGALIAHQHKVNKYIIDAMVMAAGTPVVAADAGALSKTLESLVFTGIGMRYSYRLATDAQLEVVAPFWLKELLKIDLAMENNRDSNSVSDAEINAWFAARNMTVQFVYDFQDPVVNGCDVTIPATVNVLMYPAGTWAKGTADVISLDSVYDSPNLEANQYTALFIEEGVLAVQKCTHTCAITLPVCVSGKGVADDIDICLSAPATA